MVSWFGCLFVFELLCVCFGLGFLSLVFGCWFCWQCWWFGFVWFSCGWCGGFIILDMCGFCITLCLGLGLVGLSGLFCFDFGVICCL